MSLLGTGPITPSPLFDTNYTENLKVINFIETDIFTDGVATLQNGVLSNLNDPTEPSDAVNKEYVDISSAVSPPDMSIQYNIGGNPFYLFGSTSSLTFNPTNNTLYSSRTKISNLILGNGTITNLSAPIALTDAVNKTYVDNFFTTNFYTITGTSQTLGAMQMVDAIVIPNTFTSNISLTTATATSLITYISSIIGATVSFTIHNTSVYNPAIPSIINVLPNTGLTIEPVGTLNIFPGYTMTSYLIITSANTITMYITGLSYTYQGSTPTSNNTNFLIGSRSINTTTFNTNITSQYVFNTNTININSLSSYSYSASQLSGIIYRSGETVRADTIQSVSSCIQTSIYGPIDYIFATGAIEFVIKNTATGSGNNVILMSGNGWTADSNSDMTIPVQHTGYFYLFVDTVAITGNIFTIGIFPTN